MTFKLMTSQVVQRARPLITHICVVGIQRVNIPVHIGLISVVIPRELFLDQSRQIPGESEWRQYGEAIFRINFSCEILQTQLRPISFPEP